MGKVRAYAFYKGYPFPPRGSFQERVVSQMVVRERNEKMAFARLLTLASTAGRGVKAEIVGDFLEEYREEVTQEKYNIGYQSLREKLALKRTQKAATDAQRLAKVAEMTVTDDELEENFNARSK